MAKFLDKLNPVERAKIIRAAERIDRNQPTLTSSADNLTDLIRRQGIGRKKGYLVIDAGGEIDHIG